MDLLEKLRAIEKRRETFARRVRDPWRDGDRARARSVRGGDRRPADAHVRFEQLSRLDAPSRGDGRGARARSRFTAPARPARARRTAPSRCTRQLEREFADWFGKRHALIFSTGYQANLSLIGALCGPGDVILIDGDSHASIYDATRQTAAAGGRHFVTIRLRACARSWSACRAGSATGWSSLKGSIPSVATSRRCARSLTSAGRTVRT